MKRNHLKEKVDLCFSYLLVTLLVVLLVIFTTGICCCSCCLLVFVVTVVTALVAVYIAVAIAPKAKRIPKKETHNDFQNQYQLNPSVVENRLQNHIIVIIKSTILSTIANIYKNKDIPTPVATLILFFTINYTTTQKNVPLKILNEKYKHTILPNSNKHVHVKVSG